VSDILVVGYGNPGRRDDGVGHYVAERIEQLTGDVETLHCNVSTLMLHQLGPELAETIKDYDLVIFVDAHSGECAEGMRMVSVESAYCPSAFTHFMNPGSLLALVMSLYHRKPQAFIVSIRGYDFDFGTELSTETQKWADMAVEQILDMIVFQRGS